MRALETQADRLKQLKELWTVTRPLRSELTIRERMEEGDALALVPLLPDEDPGSQLCPVAFNLLASALDSLGHLYRVEPERVSPDSARWREILWDYDVEGSFSAAMTQVDRTVRLYGSALVVRREETNGLSFNVFPPSRFVALSTQDDRELAAVLILEHGSEGIGQSVDYKMGAATPGHDEVLAIQHRAQYEHGTVPAGSKLWKYIDQSGVAAYSGQIHDTKPISGEEYRSHGHNRIPAVVVTGDLIPVGLSGKPLGGPDFVRNILNTSKLLSQCGDTSIMQRGQPTLAGATEGPITLSPKHVIRTTITGGFSIAASNGNPEVMLATGRIFAALCALSVGAPVTSMWRLADLTESDLRAAELVLAQDRPNRARIMARAERRIAQLMAETWPERLEPWTTKFKVPQVALSASERLEIEKQKDDRKLAPRAAVAQALSPELSAEQIEEQLQAADEEALEAVHALALVAGHAGDVTDAASDLRNPASDARAAVDPSASSVISGASRSDD
jgi:hypothetical protein